MEDSENIRFDFGAGNKGACCLQDNLAKTCVHASLRLLLSTLERETDMKRRPALDRSQQQSRGLTFAGRLSGNQDDAIERPS